MKKIILSLALLAFVSSCSNVDDNSDNTEVPNVEKPYANGILITNEGNFQSSNAEISFIKNDLSTVYNKIFATNNSNTTLGDVAQYMAFNNDLAYIVMNNSSTIEIVDRYTFKKVNQITANLNAPRAIAFSNGKIYVSNANDNTVTVYNANTNAFIKSISLDNQPEKLVATSNYVYVQSSSYASANTVEIINSSSDTNTKDLSFELPMNGITLDSNMVFVLGSDENKTEISKIENEAITKTISNVSLKSSRYLTLDNNNLYFTNGTGIYTLSKDLNSIPSSPIFNVNDNSWSTLYGFNVIDGKVFSSDANGFTDNSIVTVYDLTGNVLKTFTTEIGTNGFYKN
ncbi:hypothetical protein EG240_07365 [Paenimyroides tangerinum]|uniref:40-residue YVTN family beta-propeller repeat-containing protein n=1 Tax=Paenimyroides tangerinum TaxID=2488728 RepID=A0A3P3W765_9FLAO|nr:hypothetical protein [Paenimyroides tangerinum]RRJ91012.1 hypothetical protein EG240_07365 [Paenimyroides tangerinum]